MFEQEDLIENIRKNLNRAAKKPRVISVVSVNDGYMYQMFDDGGSLREKEGVIPNNRRVGTLAAMDKKGSDGLPVFYAAERVKSSDAYDADISYVPKPVEALYPGDPLAVWQVLDDAALARMQKKVAARVELHARSDKANAKEILDVVSTVVNKMKQEAPKIEVPKRKQKESVEVKDVT